MMLDAGYDAIRNYKVIRDAGRKPVICTRKNHVARNVHLVEHMITPPIHLVWRADPLRTMVKETY